MKAKTIDDLTVGDSAEFSKTVTESDVYGIAGITGDFNPAHIDAEYARGTYFKERIAHGILSVGFISNVLGMQLPGPGCVYIKQDVNFLAPVYFGDTITARVEVIELNHEKNRVTLSTMCSNQNGKKVIDGVAVASPGKARA